MFLQVLLKMKLVVVLFLYCGVFVRANENGAGQSETVTCDGAEMHLVCPPDRLINVEEARYGRWDGETCMAGGSNAGDSSCLLNEAVDIVISKCSGKNECRQMVGQHLFPDPCPGTSKYLTVAWSCVSTVSSCPGKVIFTLPDAADVTSLQTHGGWFRDPFQHSNRNNTAMFRIYFMGWSRFDTVDTLYEYDSIEKLSKNMPTTFHRLDSRVDGTGFIVYDGSVYYNKEQYRKVVKYDLAKQSTVMVDLPNANYHGTSPYAIGLNSDIDLAVDEEGLWAIYATETNYGNIVVSKLDKDTLAVTGTWHTSYEKLSALNAFIACGVLYVIGYDTLQIDYKYNMSSEVEEKVQIPIQHLNATTSSVKYNPSEKMLYVWDSHVASQYGVTFQAVSSIAPTSTTTRTPSTTLSTTTTTSSFNSPSPDTDDPLHPSPPGPPSPPPVTKKSCPGKESSGLQWPTTPYSSTAVLSCPGDSDNYALWICGGDPASPGWNTQQPDLSQCVSTWIKDAEEEIAIGRLSIGYLSQEVTQTLYAMKSKLKSWDIVALVQLLQHLLRAATDTASASHLTDSVLKVSSELLQPELEQLWQNLGRKIQTETAIELANVLEESAFFLSEDKIKSGLENEPSDSSSPKNTLTWSQPYATLAIRIGPVSSTTNHKDDAYSDLKKVTFRANDGDVITVVDQSLMDALGVQRGEQFAIVHLTLKNLGTKIVDANGFGAPPHLVNSQVITLSVRRMLSSGKWDAKSGSVNVTQPVELQLHHNHRSYSNHICAYWNKNLRTNDEEGSWWRSGCRKIEGNESHTTCECNHLTNFVILSSNEEFPPMGSDDDDTDVEKNSIDFLVYINAVRVGAGVSILLLLIAMIVFCYSRASSDLLTIHRNLGITVLLSQLVIVAGITLTSIPVVCAVVAGFLHFSVLSTFTWAALETLHHYLTLKEERSDRWKYYYGIGYVLPLIVVGVSAAFDREGYINHKVCWLCTSGSFMWAIIVPCVVAVSLSVLCIALILYELNKRSTSTAGRDLIKSTRLDVFKTCILMFLLPIMWCCAFIWLSGIPLMAWLFAASCVLYGTTTLVLRCFYRVEDHQSWSWPRSKNIRSGFSQPRGSSSARLVSNSSYRPSMRADGSAPSFDYLYSATPTATATTLMPINGSASMPYPSSGPIDAEMKLLSSQRVVPTLDHVTRVRDMDPTARNSFSSFEESGDFNHLDSRNPRESLHSRMERMESRSSCIDGSSRNIQGCRHPHHYEKPSTSERFNAGTTSTTHSCCYDHLHDDPLYRGSSASRSKRSCSKCMMQTQRNPTYFQQAYSSHQYETLGPFPDEEEQTALNPETCVPCQRRYDEVEQDERKMQPIHDYHVTCHPHHLHIHQQRHPDIPECSPTGTWQNTSYGFCSHGSGGKVIPRNGRNSDPLSTDQGYDTDSQQPGHRASHHSHSDGDDVRGTPGSTPGVSSKMNSIVEGYPSEDGTQILLQRSSSLSGGSENDREVELINSGPTSTPSVVKPSEGSLQPHNLEACDAIETSVGGRNSLTDTLHSWSALPGSNPRATCPEYGLNKPDRKTDPQVILAQARKNGELRSSVEYTERTGTDDKPCNGYTLPGTSEAGTKARIDLRTGGMSMITNL